MLVSGCTTGSADTQTTVTGTDDDCILASDELEAGKIDFEFTNESDDVSELYVLRDNGDVVSEVENVTTGTSRTLTVDLAAGDYEVRCKPGQTGDGFSSDFTVTGEGGAAQATADREIAFDAVDFTYENLDLSDIVTGETIRFEMSNRGDQPHEFEVLDPDDEAIGEVAAIAADYSGGATISFDAPACTPTSASWSIPHRQGAHGAGHDRDLRGLRRLSVAPACPSSCPPSCPSWTPVCSPGARLDDALRDPARLSRRRWG